jgi:hypothetical protein
MTIYNNATIKFNGLIPAEAMEKICELDEDFRECFSIENNDIVSVLGIEELPGDLSDSLNEIVDILKPYGIAPVVGEYNRYYGDYDGYDVFTGECFESMDDLGYGAWLARDRKYDDLIRAACELVDYFQFHNKNTTKAQGEKVEKLRDELKKLALI